MSSATTTPRAATTAPDRYEVYQCECCHAHYPLDYGFNRRFCRRACKYRNIAQSLLDDLRYDHRYCANCYRRMKEIAPPALSKRSAEKGKSIPECATGKQYYREHTVHDQRNIHRGESVHEYASPVLDARMTCSCPVNHHTTIDRPATGLSKQRAIEHAERLSDALSALYDEQTHDTPFDRGTFLAFVERAHSRPGLQGKDDEIFRNGLALAIDHA